MGKTLLIIGCALFLLVMMLLMTTSIAMALGGSFGGGNGSVGSPWEIEDCLDLQAVSGSLTAHYVVVTDINCSGIANFEPIGSSGTRFKGSFDGGNSSYAISNLTINRPTESEIGLFGSLNTTAVLVNTSLENVDITGQSNVGGLAGNSFGKIQDCSVSGLITGIDSNVGGLVGRNWTGLVSRSHASGWVRSSANYNHGGLVGYNVASGSINDCYALVGVEGNSRVGQLVGYNENASISNCFTIGGVNAADNVGGLVGNNTGSINNCFTIGGVVGGASTGGIVGANSGAVNSCYWANNLSATAGAGIRVGDQRLFLSSSHPVYGTWDLDNIWGMTDGVTYPYLGSPGITPPVFEIWTIVFVSIGLIGIIAFIWYRRRKVLVIAA